MARGRDINEAAEKYKGDGGEFFKLVNDKDSDVVRFLIEDQLVHEEDWFVAHEVEIEKKKRWVQCTEESDCPICGIGNKPVVKLFLQLVAKSDGKKKLWERGSTFVPKITSLINQYGDLCNRPYEIERDGIAGDTKTKYELYPLDRDDKRLEDIPVEKQKLLGPYGEGFVLQLTYEQMRDVADGRFRPERPEGGRSEERGRGDDRGRDSGRDKGRESERPARSERREEAPPAERKRGGSTDIF